MTLLHRLASMLRWLTRRAQAEQDLHDELQSFVDMAADDNVRQGTSLHDAQRMAALYLGGVEQAKERVRTARHGARFDDVGRCVRQALRQFRRRPGHAATAVILLAAGIGVAVTAFSQVNAVMWKDLRVRDPQSLRQLAWTSPKRAFAGDAFGRSYDSRIAAGETIATFSYPVYERLRDNAVQFSDVACWRPGFVNLPTAGRIQLQMVSGNYFETLGVGAAAGRTLTADDDRPGAAPAVVISHRFWQQALGGDLSALNQRLTVNGIALSVVGIAPEHFYGLDATQAADVWVPMIGYSTAAGSGAVLHDARSWTACQIVARLGAGSQDAGARAEAEGLIRQAVQDDPPQGPYAPPTVHVIDARRGLDALRTATRFPLFLGMGAAAVILVVACANVSTLLLVSGISRRKEIAMRFALGASKGRIVAESLTESLVLGICASLAGLLIAHLLNPLMPRTLHQLTATGSAGVFGLDVRPDMRVAGFAVALALLTSVGMGLAPALMAVRGELMSTVRHSGADGNRRLRSWFGARGLIVIQVALAAFMIVGASQFLRSYVNLRAVPLGYEPAGLQFFTVSPRLRENTAAARRAFVADVVARLERLPGVSSASASMYPLFGSAGAAIRMCPYDSPSYADAPIAVDGDQVVPKFFATWTIPLVTGRDFRWDDANAVIVNAAFADAFYPGESAVGRTVGIGPTCSTLATVVGVASNSTSNPRTAPQPFVYLPYTQTPFMTFALRSVTPAAGSRESLRHLIEGLQARLLTSVTTGEAYRDETVVQERFLSLLLAALGVCAIALCGMGIYGLLAYAVSARTPELGIRMALGASAGRIAWTVTRDLMVPLTCGVIAGVLAATAAGRWLEVSLFGVPRADVMAWAVAIAVSLAVAGVAAAIPTWRAISLRPALLQKNA